MKRVKTHRTEPAHRFVWRDRAGEAARAVGRRTCQFGGRVSAARSIRFALIVMFLQVLVARP